MNDRWLSIGEVARLLHISRPTASKHLQSGEIPGRVVHLGYPRVERKVFEKWMDSKDRVKTG